MSVNRRLRHLTKVRGLLLVVLASRHDRSARSLVEHWAAFGAGMITCEDLSIAGWRFCPSSPDASTAVLDGRVVPCKDIVGVLTRMPCIFPWELIRIRCEDRAYVADAALQYLRGESGPSPHRS